jgi:drug/metabolite transporter (DMT)-like permease
MAACFHRVTPHANTGVALATRGSGRFPALAPRRRPTQHSSMNLRRAISSKLVSVLLFAVMSALVRHLGETIPLGQMVFFGSAFAIIPVMVIYAWRGELGAALRTGRPLGHVTRGLIAVISMFLNFAALARLPLVDATAISFAAPFITVALAALVLKEPVRAYRWSAVVVGFGGVLVMLWPYLGAGALVAAGSTASTIGAACAVTAAFTNASATIQTRRLTNSETTASIVFYFSLICTVAGLASLPFAWHAPSATELTALISIGVIGGLSHIFLTESYRYAPASVVAPFDYVALLWAFFFGYMLFGEIPSRYVYAGAAIVAGSGLFVIWRERRRGLKSQPSGKML